MKRPLLITTSLVVIAIIIFITWFGWRVLRALNGRATLATDYGEILNEPAMAVPEPERAWPLWLDAFVAKPDSGLLEVNADLFRTPLDGDTAAGLQQAYRSFRAVIHRRSLDRRGRVVDDAALPEARACVRAAWDAVLGDVSPAG